jgi:actin-related protein 8
MAADLRKNMQLNKRKLMPNSRELVINHNRRQLPEIISEHNDPSRIEWTDVSGKPPPDYFTGMGALRIPQDSIPKYHLKWPIRNGWFNERDYKQKNLLLSDYFCIIQDAIQYDMGIDRKEWTNYSCVFVVPDLYEKFLVVESLHELMTGFGFRRVCFIQESLASSFGAGYSISCVLDIGAEKTSICCVEDGMCVEDSRINMKYGGQDVTELFFKMMLHDHFPYPEIDLNKRHDFLLAEELKCLHATMDDSNLPIPSVNLDFHLRISGQDTRRYSWRAYDEVLLSIMVGFILFEHHLLTFPRATINRNSLNWKANLTVAESSLIGHTTCTTARPTIPLQ